MDEMATAARAGAISRGGTPLWAVLRRSPAACVGLGLVAFWVAASLLAPLLAPYPPNANDYAALADPTPSAAHWLGTDHLGRDMLSRILWGGLRVLGVAPLAVLAAYLAGVAMGLAAGYYRGWVDAVVSRLSDIVLSFPVIILYMIVLARFGPSWLNIVLAVTFVAAPQVGRIVRGLTLEIAETDFVAAARTRGESGLYIMVVEILPNARGPLVVDACLRMGYTIIIIGALGFLGLGLPPPDPDWGGMVKDTYAMMLSHPHMTLFPCIAISSLVVGFNLLADGLREAGLDG